MQKKKQRSGYARQYMSLYVVSDVSAKANCSITSIFPTTLTASGGKFVDGTKNVEIHCTCTDVNGMASNYVRWYDPDGEGVFERSYHKYVPGTPYFETTLDNYALVIPIFNGSYDGVYTCEIVNNYSYVKPKATVNLTLDGKYTCTKI